MRTNLIKSPDNKIISIYTDIKSQLDEYLKKELSSSLAEVVSENLTRKVIKKIFMPIIYGQTNFSILPDIRVALSQYISEGECVLIGKACTSFWKTRYHEMDCLINLISDIGWIASASNRPVMYGVKYCETVQDYHQTRRVQGYMTDPDRKVGVFQSTN